LDLTVGVGAVDPLVEDLAVVAQRDAPLGAALRVVEVDVDLEAAVVLLDVEVDLCTGAAELTVGGEGGGGAESGQRGGQQSGGTEGGDRRAEGEHEDPLVELMWGCAPLTGAVPPASLPAVRSG